MANLVAPVNVLTPVEERILEFKGLNRKPVVEEGEMSAMENLTSDNYPLLTPRKPRGVYRLPEGVTIPLELSSRYEKIAMIAKDGEGNVGFYFDGRKIDSVTGLSETSHMVAINTKMCFFPQKTYLEIIGSGTSVTIGSFGYLEETFTAASAVDVEISIEDARINLGADKSFAYDDALNISGTLTYIDSEEVSHSTPCVVSCIVETVEGQTLVLPRETFIELTGEGAHDIKFAGTISRTMPDMDMVLEWNNRLWGASSRDNTIYACKLGDPKNWQYYQGTSLDSYYAQQGTDGIWTGCAPYSNHVIFFKQNSMTRIYGSAPSNFQIANMQCYGVEEGSRKSVVVVNDSVFYKSVIGIMVYEGGAPYVISDKFNMRFKNVVAGTEGRKYYASVQPESGGHELLVLDIERAVWHREDSLRFDGACTLDNKLYFVETDSESLKCSNDVIASNWLLVGTGQATSGEVHIINPDVNAETYQDIPWSATFGPFDEFMENRKIYSKVLIRLVPNEENAVVRVYISINEGEWELIKEFNPARKGGEFIPVIPRRCDRYSIKIEGLGNCSIKSLTRRVRLGTGGKL